MATLHVKKKKMQWSHSACRCASYVIGSIVCLYCMSRVHVVVLHMSLAPLYVFIARLECMSLCFICHWLHCMSLLHVYSACRYASYVIGSIVCLYCTSRVHVVVLRMSLAPLYVFIARLECMSLCFISHNTTQEQLFCKRDM